MNAINRSEVTKREMNPYEELLDRARPEAPSPMSRAHRAAQFAPFAALTGLEEALDEEARLTARRVPLSPEEEDALNASLHALEERLPERPTVTLLCFEDDPTKDGGRYVTVTGRVRAVDETNGELLFCDGRRLPLSAVCAITTSW